MIWLLLMFAQGAASPPQAQRGEALYYGTARCATCHALKSRGTAVGPDLTRIARIPPRAIAMSIRATRTQYVQNVKVKDAEPFPGMKSGEDEKTVQYFDLSADPPAARKLERAQIESATDNSTWKHPPASAKLTSEQLADIVAYIRWAAYGDRKTVDPSEVE